MGTLAVTDIRAYYNVIRISRMIKARDYLNPLIQRYSLPNITMAPCSDSLVVTSDDSDIRTYYKFILALMDKVKFSKVKIGIDPGKKIGIAVIGDGYLIDLRSFLNISEVLRFISDIVDLSDRILIKIGNGANGRKIVSSLRNIFKDRDHSKVRIVTVDEYDASHIVSLYGIKFKKRYEDMISALQIVLKYVPLEEDL